MDILIKINLSGIKKVLVQSFFALLTFGLIFNLSFTAYPSLSTGRLSVMVLLLIYFNDAIALLNHFVRRFNYFILILVILLPFTMLWFAINGAEDGVMLSRVIWFFIFSILGMLLYVRMCNFRLIAAMWFYLVATLAQTGFVFYSVFEPSFREWVEVVLVNGGNIDFSDGVRFSGLSNGGGAGLSLQLSLGVVASLVLFQLSNKPTFRIILMLAALLITAATIFVGRTGLYVSLMTLLGFMILSGRSVWVALVLAASIWGSSAYVSTIASGDMQVDVETVKLDRTVDWAFEIFLFGESSSANALVSELAKVREMTVVNLLFGAGRVQENDGSNYSGHDAGYLQTVYALGLPMSLLFYGALLVVCWRMLRLARAELKLIGVFLILLLFLLEVKEPFIFKYTLPFFVFTYLYLSRFSYNGVGMK